MTIAYYWPIALGVAANIVYHLCAKYVPASMNPFASLTETYLVATVCSAGLYLVTNKGVGLLREVGKMNWASVVLGLAVMCMEFGYIIAYRVGWEVSKASATQTVIGIAVLLVAGAVLFREPITLKKALGVLLCLAGLFLINN